MKRFIPVAIVAALIAAGVVLSLTVGGGGGNQAQSSTAIVDPPTELEFKRPIDPPPSVYKELKPGDAEFDRFPADFSDFPLYWLGDEFQGHSLRYIIRDVLSPQSGMWTENSVRFLYGSCAAEEIADGGCPPPLQIIAEPYCLKPPSMMPNQASGTAKFRGGAESMTSPNALRVWTGGVAIKIYASTPELLDAATAGFYSSNGLGPAGAGDTLPAPDRDCSDYETIPFLLD